MARVQFAAAFDRNLERIRAFWTGNPNEFPRLVDDLEATVIPNLELYPFVGRPFRSRKARSVESRQRRSVLFERLGTAEIREYIAGDYLILYWVDRPGDTVILVAIRHHRELSFDIRMGFGLD